MTPEDFTVEWDETGIELCCPVCPWSAWWSWLYPTIWFLRNEARNHIIEEHDA